MTETERQETAVAEEEEERYMEGMAVVDFDMLCSTVAMQTHGKWTKLNTSDDHHHAAADAGVLRMWEGDLLDCLEDRRIAIESACCPCYRYGKNMRRAGFGSCFLQGSMHFVIVLSALLSCIAFIVTKRNCFLYMSIAFTISVGLYLGFFRTQMRKKFNIMGNDSSLDDCIYHLICPCCTLCQESRTLEMNNIQDGTWHGRGDTICVEGTKAFFELQPPHHVPPMDCTVQISINNHS